MKSKKTHILFLGTSTHLGGAERSLLGFLTNFSEDVEKHQCSTLFPKNSGPLIDEIQKLRIPVHVIPWPQLFLRSSRSNSFSIALASLFNAPQLLWYLVKLLRFLKKNNVTHAHSTGIKCHIFLCLISLFSKIQITIHFRDSLTSPYLKFFFHCFKNKKNISWVSASNYIKSTAPDLPIQQVYDGFNAKIFFPQRNTFLKQQLRLPFGCPLVVMVGVIARWKGQREFIEAAAKVISEVPRVHFAIVGEKIYDTKADSDYYDELTELCRQLQIEDRVHFVKFQKQPEIIYNSADLVIHCSIAPEPFGRVVVEAMLCQTPVIASRAGGILEIIQDTVTGFLHTPGDVSDLSIKIRNCLLKEDLQSQILAAYISAKKSFDSIKQYQAQKEIFLKISQ